MITRRDVVVAIAAVCVGVAAVALADTVVKPVMHSSVFNWADFKVETKPTGARREVFDSRTATMDALECHVTTLNPGQIPHPAHQHADEELLIVKEGTLEVVQSGVTNHAGPGAVIFQASNELHGLRNIGQVPATYYVIKFSAGVSKTP